MIRQTPLLRFNLARQLPTGRHLANRQPSSDLRRFDNGRNVIGLAWRTARSAGIHRSVLQRADLRPCWRLGVIQHREFAMASGQMSQAEFTAFLQSIFGHLAAYSTDGSIHFQCMDWRHLQEMQAAGTAAYTDLKNICVWAKNNGGMGSLSRSQHEFVFVFKSGTAPHINNVELGIRVSFIRVLRFHVIAAQQLAATLSLRKRGRRTASYIKGSDPQWLPRHRG